MTTPAADQLAAFLDDVRSGEVASVGRFLQAQPGLLYQREKSEDGWAAIHHAAAIGHVEVASLLLTAGCAPTLPSGEDDGDGSYLPGTTPMAVAAWKGQVCIAKLLLEHGADPTGSDHFGHSAIHVAAGHNQVAILNLLLAHGAWPGGISSRRHFDEELDWHFYGSPLHMAALNNAVEAARVLLAHGARLDECWNDQRTPLFYAAATGATEVALLLLEAGADPNAREDRASYSARLDYTPLHYAAENGHVETVKTLLSYGADPALRESQRKRTACQLARTKRHKSVVNIFEL